MSSPITLDSFVSMLAHDLRSPLAFIIGYADLLLEGYFDPLTESQAEQVRSIRENAQRAANLVSLLSDVFKLGQGQLTLALDPTDVQQMLSQVANDLKAVLTSRHQRLEIVSESTSHIAMLDGDRLQKALTLLLRLAAQHGPAHSVLRLHIVDQTEEDGDVLVITGHILSPVQTDINFPPEQPPSTRLLIPVFIAQNLLQAHGGCLFWSEGKTDREFLRIEIPKNREALPI
ncbi:MAG: histidine kinase dimerization/phospho-acceptor domain-containing protein [Anaerolineae bacterium]|nr:hypothetical protein [Anaerolineae bacterium]MDW8099583.1 histidine kinase dimerization/phospho-acceptor domain-containing protein [Anaerolineae bacterium]